MAKIRKKLSGLLLVLLFFYFLWLTFQILSFRNYKESKEPSFSKEIMGAYHIHSTFSDGKKSLPKIAEYASKSSLDFCILTDHGNPNFESLESQGWEKGVLVLAGSELSVNRGHLVALGFDYPQNKFSQEAESAAYQIAELNGFSIIAHPYSKTKWTWGEYAGYSGIEIINADAMARRNSVHLLPYLPALLVKPELPILKTIKNPTPNLMKWDWLNKDFTVYGYYSTDAHMLYSPLFSLLRIHLLLEENLSLVFEKAKNQVFHALENGRFFNSIDAAAPATGFRFWGETENNKIFMGESLLFNKKVSFFVKTPDSLSCKTVLIHNGKPILTETKELVSFTPTEPGVYRVEVFLLEKTPLDKSCPWILSNPIFLREKADD